MSAAPALARAAAMEDDTVTDLQSLSHAELQRILAQRRAFTQFLIDELKRLRGASDLEQRISELEGALEEVASGDIHNVDQPLMHGLVDAVAHAERDRAEDAYHGARKLAEGQQSHGPLMDWQSRAQRVMEIMEKKAAEEKNPPAPEQPAQKDWFLMPNYGQAGSFPTAYKRLDGSSDCFVDVARADRLKYTDAVELALDPERAPPVTPALVVDLMSGRR